MGALDSLFGIRKLFLGATELATRGKLRLVGSGWGITDDAANEQTILTLNAFAPLVLTYGANKTLTIDDFGGADLRLGATIFVTAAATIKLPTDASRVLGATITFVRTFNGNAVIDGNGANVQGRSHSFGATNWFQGSTNGTITYKWTGTVWAYVGIPGSVDGQIQAQAVYDPNAFAFVDNGVSRTGLLPIQRAAATVTTGGTINCDHPMTDGKRSKVKFRFSVGTDYVLEYEAVAKRSGVTVTLLSSLKTLYGPSEYSVPPTVSPALSAPGGGILRCALQQSTGSSQACTASSGAEEQ